MFISDERFACIYKSRSDNPYADSVGSSILHRRAMACSELNIWFGKITNNFTYYEDDGSTFKYRMEIITHVLLTWNPIQKVITLNKKNGNMFPNFKR